MTSNMRPKTLFLVLMTTVLLWPSALCAQSLRHILTFSDDEQQQKAMYDEVNRMMNDKDNSLAADDAEPYIKDMENDDATPFPKSKYQFVYALRFMECGHGLIDKYTPNTWMLLCTKMLETTFFTWKVGIQEKKVDLLDFQNREKTHQLCKSITRSFEDMGGGNQFEINRCSYLYSMIGDYQALYYTYVTSHHLTSSPEILRLVENETQAWWDMHEAAANFYYYVLTGGEWYSMKPLEVYGLEGNIDEQRVESVSLLVNQKDVADEQAEKKTYDAIYAEFSVKVKEGLQSESDDARQSAQSMLNAWTAFKDAHLALPISNKAALWKDLAQYLNNILYSYVLYSNIY